MDVPTNDQALLEGVVQAVQTAANAIRARFSIDARPAGIADIGTRIRENDAISMQILRDQLFDLRPDARIEEDEAAAGAFPAGEWWVVDPVEGAINQVHGMTEWCVTATLIRDNQLVLAVVHLPLSDQTYTALRGHGAFLNSKRLSVSRKPDLRGTMVGTGQAMPGESVEIHRLIGSSVTMMLGQTLTVRVSVPATLQLIHVAAGRMDAFWQFSQVRSGLVSGALLVAEAGGVVTDLHGNPWTLESQHFLATAPQLSTPITQLLGQMLELQAAPLSPKEIK
jgi:myo-inositol-1(or 4)-monophosphatase